VAIVHVRSLLRRWQAIIGHAGEFMPQAYFDCA